MQDKSRQSNIKKFAKNDVNTKGIQMIVAFWLKDKITKICQSYWLARNFLHASVWVVHNLECGMFLQAFFIRMELTIDNFKPLFISKCQISLHNKISLSIVTLFAVFLLLPPPPHSSPPPYHDTKFWKWDITLTE